MSEHSPIGWTDHTFNIAWGCERVSPGCAHCYAETLATRYGFNVWGPASQARRTFGEKHWREPLLWNRKAEAEGIRRRVFCSSMADVWEDHPFIDAEREKLWPLIRETPWLDWQLLTKRPERIAATLPADWDDGAGYPNVWLGTSIENQRFAYRGHALPRATVRFLSCEPLLGPLDLSEYMLLPGDGSRIDWIIVGGESGPDFRPMQIEWLEAIVSEAASFGIPCFVKQDSHRRSGQRGRIADAFWLHDFPASPATREG